MDLNFHLARITVNLAPANLKKEGSQLDLAIALGILRAMGVISDFDFQETAFIGELSLDGTIKPYRGCITYGYFYEENQILKDALFLMKIEMKLQLVEDIDIIPVKNLNEAINYLNGEEEILPYKNTIPLF